MQPISGSAPSTPPEALSHCRCSLRAKTRGRSPHTLLPSGRDRGPVRCAAAVHGNPNLLPWRAGRARARLVKHRVLAARPAARLVQPEQDGMQRGAAQSDGADAGPGWVLGQGTRVAQPGQDAIRSLPPGACPGGGAVRSGGTDGGPGWVRGHGGSGCGTRTGCHTEPATGRLSRWWHAAVGGGCGGPVRGHRHGGPLGQAAGSAVLGQDAIQRDAVRPRPVVPYPDRMPYNGKRCGRAGRRPGSGRSLGKGRGLPASDDTPYNGGRCGRAGRRPGSGRCLGRGGSLPASDDTPY
jgi:hypothetical protein